MTIPAEAMVEPLNNFDSGLPIVDGQTGILTEFGLKMLQQFRDFVSGMSRVIPCDVDGDVDSLTLTPAQTAPKPDRYNDHDIFIGRMGFTLSSAATAVYAEVLDASGTSLGLKQVYLTNGASATGVEVLENCLYLFIYDSQIGDAGGFVVK